MYEIEELQKKFPRYPKGTPWFRDGKKWDRPEGAYSTDLISDFVAEFIEGSAESKTPFFIYDGEKQIEAPQHFHQPLMDQAVGYRDQHPAGPAGD